MSDRSLAEEASIYGETCVYKSIVGALPGLGLSDRVAPIVQFGLFEALLLVVAAVYGRWDAVLPGTVAILIPAVGSAFMLDIGRRVRSIDMPATYRMLTFSTSLEVVFGVVGYAAALTILFVYQPRHGPTLLEAVLGPRVPILAAFLFFMILWDIVYRIGSGWWIALVALWRAFALDVDEGAAAELRAIDNRSAAFAVLQLLFVPFILDYPVLLAGLVGHVLAVLLLVAVARLKTGR